MSDNSHDADWTPKNSHNRGSKHEKLSMYNTSHYLSEEIENNGTEEWSLRIWYAIV